MSSLRQLTQAVNQTDDVVRVLEWTDSGCLPVQRIAVMRLKALCQHDANNIGKLVAATLIQTCAARINAVCALVPQEIAATLLQQLLHQLQTFTPDIQKSVARLICRSATDRISELISKTTASSARILCFHAIRGELTHEQLHSLQKELNEFDLPGLQHLLQTIIELDSVCTHQNEFLHDLQNISLWIFSRQLGAPKTTILLSDGRPLNALSVDNEDDIKLLIAAIRHAEREELRSRELPDSWSFFGLLDELDAHCQFINLPLDQLHLQCIQRPLQESKTLGVPPELQVPFIFETVATQLLGEDVRWEAETFRIARWRAMSLNNDWSLGGYEISISQNGQRRLPQAMGLISHRFKSNLQTALAAATIRNTRHGIQTIAPGAAAAIHIWRTVDSSTAHERESALLVAETFWSHRLTPIGIEIQIPRVERDEYIGWLEFFRSHGIPVPRRPECGSLFELAVPPAASWHAPAEILKALSLLQVAHHSQDVAIHVSLQGDLGDAGGALAFTQLFLNTSTIRQPRASSALRHVMSKGLVHRNQDIVACNWATPSICRTELRVIILPVLESLSRETEVDNVIRTLRELQLLGSAALSESPTIWQFFSEFRQDLESLVASYPKCLKELLDTDFYECTGDYRAISLLDKSGILKRRKKVQSEIQGELERQLTNEIQSLRSTHADRLEEYFTSNP